MAGRNEPRRFTEVFGQKLSLAELGALTGIDKETIRQRLNLGWSVERVLNTPRQNVQNTVMMGEKFGWLTVQEEGPSYVNERNGYICKSRRLRCFCVCGRVVLAREYDLKCGDKISCGCNGTKFDLTGTILNASGSRVLECIAEPIEPVITFSIWRCECACGAYFEENGRKLAAKHRTWCTLFCHVKISMRGDTVRKSRYSSAKKYKIDDEYLTISEMAKRAGVTNEAIHHRLKIQGMSPQQACDPPMKLRKYNLSDEHDFYEGEGICPV